LPLPKVSIDAGARIICLEGKKLRELYVKKFDKGKRLTDNNLYTLGYQNLLGVASYAALWFELFA
jgi:hypothetical protein